MLWLIAIAVVIGLPVCAILGTVAFARSQRAEGELRRLGADVELLRIQLDHLQQQPERPSAAPEPSTDLPPEPQMSTPEDEATVEGQPPEPDQPEPAQPEAPRPTWQAPPAAAPSGDRWASFEESFTSSWLIWLGGLAIALGGGFLVKFGIDQGLLGPGPRTVIGLIFGLALIVGGEWLRQRPLERLLAAVKPSYIPAALTAGGLFTLFAVIYAAYALYGFISPLVAFAGLALVSILAFGLSLLQGPFIAALAIVGGYAVPILVSTDSPDALSLFAYLLVLQVTALATLRYMAWWWLGWLTLAGAVLWVVLWLVGPYATGDAPIQAVYILLTSALFLFLRYRAPDDVSNAGLAPLHFEGLPVAVVQAWFAAMAAGLLFFMLVRVDGYGAPMLILLGLLASLWLFTARREAVFDSLPVIGLGLVVALVATWHLPHIITDPGPMFEFDGESHGQLAGPVVPPELTMFVTASIGFAALFAFACFAALWGAKRPSLWAAVSTAAPLLLMIVAYGRIARFELDFAWAAISLGVGLLNLIAAHRVARYRDHAGMNAALGAYAVGVVVAVTLAATMVLEEAWLTVALALQLPAIAWINDKLNVAGLRHVAVVLGGAVLTRLALNPALIDYRDAGLPILNWILYGYGIPALAFYLAARVFRRQKDDHLVALLEAGALAFATLLVSLQLRHLMNVGDLTARYGFAEMTLQSIAWLSIGYALYLAQGRRDRFVSRWGWRILTGLGTLQVVGGQVLFFNPVFHWGERVGDWPVFNLLLLGYGVPALFAGLFARQFARQGETRLSQIAGVAVLTLPFVELTLEIRRAFHGPVLYGGFVSDPEWYAYSAGWLVYAGVLLALGIWRGSAELRYASLAIVMLTVAKVFLVDMSELTGILRALSFIGLGLTLVGVGWLYRRFVFPPAPLAPTAGAGAPASD